MSLGRRNWWEQQLHFSSNGRVFVLPFFVTENSFSSRSINRTDLVENAQKWFRTCVCGVCVRVLWIICYDVAKTIFIACDMINATFGKVKKKNHRHKSTAIQIKMGCTRCVRAPKITIQMKCEFVVLNASTELNLFLASFDVNNLFPVEKKKKNLRQFVIFMKEDCKNCMYASSSCSIVNWTRKSGIFHRWLFVLYFVLFIFRSATLDFIVCCCRMG